MNPGDRLTQSYESHWNKKLHEMTELPEEELSACCGASIHWGDICSNCGEHTEPYKD